MVQDYRPQLPDPLRPNPNPPYVADLTSLSDWKAATNAGVFSFRNNTHTVAIDEAIIAYHAAARLWEKYIQLDKISTQAAAWITSKEDKQDSTRRPAYAAIIKHVLALRRWPTLEPINRVVYRGSSRAPAEVFQTGFEPQKTSPPISIGTDGHTWTDGAASKSQVVSTTLRAGVAAQHYAKSGYLYAMYITEGIDLKENGDYEIATLGVPSTSIIGAVGKLSDRQSLLTGNSDLALYTMNALSMVDDAPHYFVNNGSNVAPGDARLGLCWLQRLAGEEMDDGDRQFLAQHVRNQ